MLESTLVAASVLEQGLVAMLVRESAALVLGLLAAVLASGLLRCTMFVNLGKKAN